MLLKQAVDSLVELRLDDAIHEYRQILKSDPDNFWALLGIGEALTRVGLGEEALRALYRASLMRPPSWEAFQAVSMWTRAAERSAEGAFKRSTGASPPRFLVRLGEKVTGRLTAVDAGRLVAAAPPTNQMRRLR
jgi:tetratricopeptide (TPR) repeat protein